MLFLGGISRSRDFCRKIFDQLMVSRAYQSVLSPGKLELSVNRDLLYRPVCRYLRYHSRRRRRYASWFEPEL